MERENCLLFGCLETTGSWPIFPGIGRDIGRMIAIISPRVANSGKGGPT
jgi:hypothetical protein